MNMVCLPDFENKAKLILPKEIYSYYKSGAQNEITLSINHSAFDDILLVPKAFRFEGGCDTACRILGKKLSMPVMAAPTAFHKLVHPRGELATIEGLNKSGSGMVVSTMSSTSMEEIAIANKGEMLWFQLYMFSDNNITESLIKRAEKARYDAIVVTVDVPVMGRRYDDMRFQFKLPLDLIAENIPENIVSDLYGIDTNSSIKNFTDKYFKKYITFKDIEWLKSITSLPIIIKGIMHPKDALDICNLGIDGIIVSNHGGRQLDTAISTINILPHISKKIDGRFSIFIDSGFKHGTDILKALALGAEAVLIGRPILWGLACEGAEGVFNVLNILCDELKEAMMMCGFNSIDQIKKQGKDLIYRKFEFKNC